MYSSKSDYKKPKVKDQEPKVEVDNPKKKSQVRVKHAKMFDTTSSKSKSKQ